MKELLEVKEMADSVEILIRDIKKKLVLVDADNEKRIEQNLNFGVMAIYEMSNGNWIASVHIERPNGQTLTIRGAERHKELTHCKKAAGNLYEQYIDLVKAE